MVRPKPLLEKQPQTFTLIGCLTVGTNFFFSGKFQIGPFTEFKRIVVSSENIIWFQSVALWCCAHLRRFFRWRSIRSGFDIGRLYLAPVSFKLRRTVLPLTTTPCRFSLFEISCAVINVFSLASEIIRWSCFWVVARGLPERFESVKSLDYFHLSSQYFTVYMLQWTAFARSGWFSCEPFGWLDKNIISYRLCIGKDIYKKRRLIIVWKEWMIYMIRALVVLYIYIYTTLIEFSRVSRKL